MINTGFPVFDLKSTNDLIFFAGGGGSKEYGKDNGILAIKKTSLMKGVEKAEHYYKTTDLIVYLQVYTERKEEINNLLEEIKLEEAPEMADGFDSTTSDMTIPFEKESSFSSEETESKEEMQGEMQGEMQVEKQREKQEESMQVKEESMQVKEESMQVKEESMQVKEESMQGKEESMQGKSKLMKEKDQKLMKEKDQSNIESNMIETDIKTNIKKIDKKSATSLAKDKSIATSKAKSNSATSLSASKAKSSSTTSVKSSTKKASFNSQVGKTFPERKPSNSIFILAIGEENLYVLKFTSSFSLHCKLEKKVDFAFLSKHLFLLRNQKVQAFYDTIQSPSSVRFQIKKIEENVSDPTEEFVYKLYRKRTEVIALNEHFTRDIPKNWGGFFMVGNKIHKIVKNGKMNEFAYKNQKFSIEGKISRVIVQKDTLIFYSNTEKEGNLYFMGQEEKIYSLQRITAIDVWNNTTIVATADGTVITYVDGFYSQRANVACIPITGLAIDSRNMYFSQLTGEVKCIRRVSNFERGIKVVSLIIVLISIATYIFSKFIR